MAKKESAFFEVRGYNGHLCEGDMIDVQRSMVYYGEKADFKPFLNVPIKELEQRLKTSKAEEKKVYDQLQKAAKAWDEHGAQTLLLQKAIEYLKVPAVTHTSNEWKKQKDGSWEISNMVYKMTFSIVRFGDEWKLEWEIQYTAPGKSQSRSYSYYDQGPRKRIDHEGSKKYKTLDGAQKYIQLKFDQYSSYFKELSPPIPPEARDLFCVNGQLLQGYTIAHPKVQKKEVTLQDLLNCIEDGDIGKSVPEEKKEKSTSAPAAELPKGTKPPLAPVTSPKVNDPAPKKKPLHQKKKKPALAR